MKKFLKILLILILVLVVAVGGLFGLLTFTEFKPEPVEELELLKATESSDLAIPQRAELDILSWNIGYGGLGKDSDFFMDGGKNSKSANRATVKQYLSGMQSYVRGLDPDLLILQEVDTDSSRTYGIYEPEYFYDFRVSAHALNYSCPFVPIPMPPIGKVHSGLLTCSCFDVAQARRVSLPCPFSWPLSTANLKRCLLVSYLPIADSDKELVLVNLHLEAYDDGAGKIAQTRQLMDLLEEEYLKGNYVIAGGDFNQTFPGSLDAYPMLSPELWTPGVLEDESLPEGFRYAYDLSSPTCRLLNQPYDPTDLEHTQYYVIDGFILSPNVQLNSVESVDLAFENSDHNPVHLNVTLLP